MTTRSRRHTAAAGVLFVAIVLAGFIVLPANGDGVRAPAEAAVSPQPTTGSWSARVVDRMDRNNTTWIHINLVTRSESGKRRNHGQSIDSRDLEGLSLDDVRSGGSTDVAFRLLREAGRFDFTGTFRRSDGGGTFEFEPSSEYVEEMARLGYRSISEDELFSLAMIDVTTGYVRELHTLGYNDLPLDDLFALSVHDVSPERIREYGVLGHDDLTVDELVSLSIHDVDPALVREYREIGYSGMSADQLISMSIHDVDPDFIRALDEAGYRDIATEELVSMSIHDVEPGFIRGLASRGYTDLEVDELVSMMIHDVSLEMIDELKEAGFTNVPVSKLIELQIHGLSPSDIRAMTRATRPSDN